MIWRIVGNVIGLALFVVSIPLTLSPIPLGLILLFLSIVILVASNPYVKFLVRFLRRHFPWLNRFFRKAEDVLPEELAGPLHETDSGDEDEDDQDDTEARLSTRYGPPMERVSIPRRLR